VPSAAELESVLVRHVLEPWFPRCLDTEYGGFLCDFDRTWQPAGRHDKFLEFQARQTWLAALVARHLPQNEGLREAARQGLSCLRETMWDAQYGGWFHRLDRAGSPRDQGRKHAHGSAYAVAACAEASVTLGDQDALELARAGLEWLDAHARDGEHGGYFGFLRRDGAVIRDPASSPTPVDPIGTPIGLKDANVNSDLVETFNVLLDVDPRAEVRSRAAELCEIVARRMTSEDGIVAFYCQPNWARRPGTRFGTQLQTAHRLATAGRLLGTDIFDEVAGRVFRRGIELGWDRRSGGFWFADYGHRPQRREWWIETECLRGLWTLGPLAGGEGERRALEERVWGYLRRRFFDARYSGLYKESVDGLPRPRQMLGIRFAPASAVAKGDVWKDGWHEGTALLVGVTQRAGRRPAQP
jgi:mannobiose 2-epimerase